MSNIQDSLIPDMEFSDDGGDERLDGAEIPKEVRTLRTQTYDKSISDLIAMIANGDIILDPDFQRNYIWPNPKASLLVESILLNVPIPVIYVAEDKESRWLLVDGLQRLTSLKRFFDNEFKLSSLEILDELNRKQFSTLNSKAARILKNGIIRVVVIKEESHSEIKYDIFQRLNQGAVSLNAQELRNCLYRGSFCELLKALRGYGPFLDCIGLSSTHPRFYDAELLLRFYAIYDAYDVEKGEVNGYPNKMKTFLNNYMNQERDMNQVRISEFEDLLKGTVKKVLAVFPSPCFRRFKPEEGTLDTRLNRALMDVVMVSFARLEYDFVVKNKAAILRLYEKLPLENPEFNEALVYGTSDSRRLRLRLNTWWESISAL